MSTARVWYQSSVAEVMEALETNDSGLTSAEAKERLKEYGHNELEFKKRSALLRLLQQFNNPLIYVLLAAAALTLYLSIKVDAKFIVDTGVIFAVVVINAIIGFIQEGKAEASLEMLKGMMVPECTVLRDGQKKTIPARDLVPGDIVILDEGDRVPADLRLFYAKNLSADEAALTGESVPVSKNIAVIPDPNLSPGDQRDMAFSGTFITRGSGQGIVVGTREQTELGKIAALLKQTHRAISTPFLRKIAEFTKALLIATSCLAAITVGLGFFLGYDLVRSFLTSVALVVAVIPEGLPAVLSIALAAGARAMVHRNVLIRRLPAVETLGSTTVICSDKTGTLTESEMTVARVYCARKNYKVTGAGYEPSGEFILDEKSINPTQDDDLAKTLAAGFMCNNVSLKKEGNKYQISGDPTEGALVVSAAKAGITEKLPMLDEIPFESEHRYMATLHQDTGSNVIYVKGSPEKILEMCQMQLVNGRLEPLEIKEIMGIASAMTKDALRVLGLAYKEVPSNKAALTREDMNGLIFLGLQGMMDPPRKEAIEAVAKCKKAGIRVIMATGDHPNTAEAVARQLGLGHNGRVLTGEELTKMSDEELYEVVEDVSVYARVAPAHKFRIVTQLQKRGHIVAVTGDGVNDAPALKAADLGVAMGIKGTEVSKEASDMVLVDDNFASIVAAVEEGRHVFENIRKAILYILPTNIGQGLIMLGSIVLAAFVPLFSIRLPLEPVQILWINLYVAVVLALPLLWEPREKGLLDRPPRDPREPIANRLFFRKVGLVGLVMAASAFILFYRLGMPAISGSELDELMLRQAQTAVLMNVMLVQIFYLLAARSLTVSAFKLNPFSNKKVLIGIVATIVIHLILVYVPHYTGVNPLRTAPFPAEWWIFIILLALPGLLAVELEGFLIGRFSSRRHKKARGSNIYHRS